MNGIAGVLAAGGCLVIVTGAIRAEESAATVARGGRPSARPDAAAPLEFFRRWTPGPAQQERVGRLVKQLDAASYKEREKATAELLTEGRSVVPLLRLALPEAPLERRMRLEKCIKALEPPDWAETVADAARLVRECDAPGGESILLAYLPFAPEDAVDALTETLFRLAARHGTVNALLVPALDDAAPARRAAAALIVALAGTPEQRERAGRLLNDPDPMVRFRASHGLLATGDKRAIPVLIALLKTEHPIAERAEGLLTNLELKDAPQVPLGERVKCHAAWSAWWDRHGAQLELPRSGAALCLMDPHQLARRAAGDFFAGLGRGDPALLRRSVDVPFYLAGNVLLTREAFDSLYASVLQSNKTTRSNFRVRVVRCLTPSAQLSYCQNDGDRAHIRQLSAGSTVVVHCVFSYQEGGQNVDLYSAVFVRVTAGGGRVTGFCNIDRQAVQ